MPISNRQRSGDGSSIRRLSIPLIAGLLVSAPPARAQGSTERVSVTATGAQANSASYQGSSSADASIVAFRSSASNLTPAGGNAFGQVYVRNRQTGTITLVSASPQGALADFYSQHVRLSADGTTVVFASNASNLVGGDTNGARDVFVRDLASGVTTRIDVGPGGVEANGDADSGFGLGISADGRYVLYSSFAWNLVPGDVNGASSVFFHDRVTGTTEIVDRSTAGVQGLGAATANALSADARFVVFSSNAPNLVPNDTNQEADVFLRDRATGSTIRVNVGPGGIEADDFALGVDVSDDGRFVVFQSRATNLIANDANGAVEDVFVRDVVAGTTELVSQTTAETQIGTGTIVVHTSASNGAISADGRFVAFQSSGAFVPDDFAATGGIYLRDRTTGTTTRVSVTSQGQEAVGYSSYGALTPDGRWVLFTSTAGTLVPGDTNGLSDVFLHERAPAIPAVYCTAKLSSQGCLPAIAASGVASLASAAPLSISATNVTNQRPGILLYSLAPDHGPFPGAVLCVAQPLHWLGFQVSGGNTGPADCSGTFLLDFKPHAQSGLDPNLVPGTVVHAQWVFSDPGAAVSGRGSTDAIAFTLEP